MRVLFIFPRPNPYDSRTVRELPSGGTEKAVIFLGEALQQLGHEVEWITTPEQLGQGPQQPPEVVITQVAELFLNFPTAKKVWWTHHFSDQPVIQANAGYGRALADKVVTLSQCHAKDFRDNLRMDSVTIGHGIWPEEIAQFWGGGRKDSYRLIYASTPFRGLARIPELFREIKTHEPRATIAICSSMGTYGEPGKDAEYQAIFDELATIEGVELLGALNQQALYEQYARASVFFYPCTWPETYCMALDEAIAHGCVPVTTNLGALPERNMFASGLEEDMRVQPLALMDGYRRPTHSWITPVLWTQIAQQWETHVLN